VLEEDERRAASRVELDEVRRLERALREENAVVGDDPDRVAPDPREAGDERRPVERLELVEARAVDDPRDDLAHVVRLPRALRDDAVELLGRVERLQDGLEWPGE